MESPFDILLIEPDADEAEIERAYRERVKEAHPDHGGSAAEFQLVQAAYEELTSGTAGSVRARSRERESPPEPTLTDVEYINYEVLDDYDWSLEDDDLFEKAAAEGLEPSDHGQFAVKPDETLLEAAERCGFSWPFACRGGACANCAVALVEGEMTTPVNHVLPSEMIDRGIRLSCVGTPTTETKVVYNVKELPDLDELRLPPRPFEQANLTD